MRVIVADDAVLFREGLGRILTDAGFDVVGQVGDGAALVNLVRREPPEVAIIDLRMPPDHSDEGIQAAIQIRAQAPAVGLMVLSQYVETHHALQLMTEFEGGVGYLLKDRVSDLAAFAIDVRRVARGEVVIDPELVSRLVGRRRRRDPIAELSIRERHVLGLMARGLSNSAIAQEMHLSPKTIEGHITSIFTKLDLAPDDREQRRVLAVLRFLRQE